MTVDRLFEKSIHTLEFYKVLEMLSADAVSADAKELAKSLRPAVDLTEALRRQGETTGAKNLSQRQGSPSFSGVKNVLGSLRRADMGAPLSPRELLDIARLLTVIRGLARYRSEKSELATCLDEIFSLLSPNKFLEERITGAILSEEEIADTASPALSDIRRAQKRAHEKIRSVLQKMIHSTTQQKFLQEPIITMRSERYVLPVKAANRGDVPGLVHDSSGSGSTLFIEPMAVVEANNELKVLKAKEEEEIDRILAELSAAVAEASAIIEADYHRVIRLDFIFAKARLSDALRAAVPLLNDKGKISLRKARHPLIDPKIVVPVDIELGERFHTLVITGPNTGGKTVTLKTIGLLTLMAQAGLHIPVLDGSELSVFDRVFADIGDEQSIEQSLSTFSSHMTNIVEIIANAQKGTLVLFDELGAGTDPVEGAALAITILEEMGHRGVITAATTHYVELKTFAMKTGGVENASCEFDVETLKPTYRLLIGIPGKSNAFAISQRLGLPVELIERANTFIDEDAMRFEDVFADLEHARQKLERETDTAEGLRREMEAAKRALDEEREKTERESAREMERARVDARRLVEQAKFSYDQVANELEALRKLQIEDSDAQRLADARRAVKSHLAKMEDEATPVARKREDGYRLPRPLVVGDTVELRAIKKRGTVMTLPDKAGNLTVQAGIIGTKVNAKDLRLIEEKFAGDIALKYMPAASTNIKTMAARTEIDLRGKMSEEAISEVDQFLDNATLAQIPSVTIIHGKGTGALRTAIQNHLKHHPVVKSYRQGRYGEGEMGVTIVEIK